MAEPVGHPVPPPGTRIVTSFVKAGRTWLRFMLSTYLARLYGLDLTVDLHSQFRVIPNNEFGDPLRGIEAFAFAAVPGFPRIRCEHVVWQPFDPERNPTTVIVRSPVDCVVSAYFMNSRRSGQPDLPVGAYLRAKKVGIARWIGYHNDLLRERGDPGVLWVSYEQMSEDAGAVLARVLGRFGIPVEPDLVEAAVAAGRFERMAALESRQGFPGNKADPADPGARRMREGRVGGGAALLAPADTAHVARALARDLAPGARARMEALGVRFP